MPATVVMEPAEDRLDLRELLRTLWRKRWWIVGSTIVCTALAVTLILVTTPVYRAVVVLAPANVGGISDSLGSRLSQLGGLVSLAGLDFGSATSEADVSLAVLRSRQFTEEFIASYGLKARFFADKWDDTKRAWRVPADRVPSSWRAFRYFEGNVRTIAQDKRTGFVTVQIDWYNAAEAAQWANDLARRLNEEMRERAIRESDASIGFLEKELEKTGTVTTREAISRLIESQIKKRMLANVLPEYAFRVIDKAIPADLDAPVRPRKFWLLAAGVFGGFTLGVLLALFSTWFAPPPAARG